MNTFSDKLYFQNVDCRAKSSRHRMQIYMIEQNAKSDRKLNISSDANKLTFHSFYIAFMNLFVKIEYAT